jgi:hypothetical protein
MGILDLFRGSKSARIARKVMAEMRTLGETRRMEFHESNGSIVILDENGKQAATWSLGNLRHELDRAPESQHDGIYQRYLDGFKALTTDDERPYSQVRPALRILLKDASYPAYIDVLNRVEHGAKGITRLVWRPVAADVIACCVEETESSLSFVNESALERWGVAAEQVLDDAFANMQALPVEFGVGEIATFVNAADSFIAARLVCDAAVRQLPLKGRPVAVVPDRDTLFMVGSEDEEGIAALARLNARQFEDANRHISGRPLVLSESGWQEFVPPESSRVAFGNVIRRFDASFWSDYQKLLEKDLEARGEDIFVAEMALYEDNETGAYFTSLAWTRDVDSILPVVERVNFFDSIDESIRYASWPDVLRVMGGVMTRLDGAPMRYRVKGFPTPEQFLAMGAKLI